MIGIHISIPDTAAKACDGFEPDLKRPLLRAFSLGKSRKDRPATKVHPAAFALLILRAGASSTMMIAAKIMAQPT